MPSLTSLLFVSISRLSASETWLSSGFFSLIKTYKFIHTNLKTLEYLEALVLGEAFSGILVDGIEPSRRPELSNSGMRPSDLRECSCALKDI